MAHRALATQMKRAYLGFQCLDHPPYSPDLAPSDYHLFPRLKKTIEREVGRAKDLTALRYEYFGETYFHHLFFRWKRQSLPKRRYQTARRRSLYDGNLKIYLCENLRSHLVKLLPS
jgi:histone-lysine N-methyltransferase SETMAR